MKPTLQELAEHAPKLPLSKEDLSLYKGGLLAMSMFVSDNFLDIPQLPENRFDQDGLFYSIPHLHDNMLGHTNHTRTLLVIYKVEDKSSFCPYRFEFDYTAENHFHIYLCDQSGERTVKHIFIERDGEKYYSEMKGVDTLTLSTIEQTLTSM